MVMILGMAIVIGLVASIDADIRYLCRRRVNKLGDHEIERLKHISIDLRQSGGDRPHLIRPEDEEYEFLPKAELWLPSPSRED